MTPSNNLNNKVIIGNGNTSDITTNFSTDGQIGWNTDQQSFMLYDSATKQFKPALSMYENLDISISGDDIQINTGAHFLFKNQSTGALEEIWEADAEVVTADSGGALTVGNMYYLYLTAVSNARQGTYALTANAPVDDTTNWYPVDSSDNRLLATFRAIATDAVELVEIIRRRYDVGEVREVCSVSTSSAGGQVDIATGSSIEYVNSSGVVLNDKITTAIALTVTTTVDTNYYLYREDDGGFELNTTRPTYSLSKKGWYNSNDKCLAQFRCYETDKVDLINIYDHDDDKADGWHFVGDGGEPAFNGYWINCIYTGTNGDVYNPLRFKREKNIGYINGTVNNTNTSAEYIFEIPASHDPIRHDYSTNMMKEYSGLIIGVDSNIAYGIKLGNNIFSGGGVGVTVGTSTLLRLESSGATGFGYTINLVYYFE